MTSPNFTTFFGSILADEDKPHPAPHPWQRRLGDETAVRDRLIRIPTGLGKTAGVVLAWAYHRLIREDDAWPRRLVFALPMRVLVEQTADTVRKWAEALQAAHGRRFDVHVLMGGVEAARFAIDPERPAVLVGTQDMLLSRALNRGYAAAPARWPPEFGLLNHDALWVLDEVQLMGVGAVTGAQLQAFRRHSDDAPLRPVATWWMSATLRSDWLRTVDSSVLVDGAESGGISVDSGDQEGGVWETRKAVERRADLTTPDEVATLVAERHQAGALTLVVVNTVKRAVEVHTALGKRYRDGASAPDIQLVHSRFRPAERAAWREGFLNRDACRADRLPPAGRVIIATQVVEAGVDISAALLISELAPWPSLVQRFGRLARYPGETGLAVVTGAVPGDDKSALPYDASSLAASDEALTRLAGPEPRVDIAALEAFDATAIASDPALAARLYPFETTHLLQKRDVVDLFDTTPDISGADVDVSRFVRDGEVRDVYVFWRDTAAIADREGGAFDADVRGRASFPASSVGPVRRDELCPVPIAAGRKWLAKLDGRVWVRDFATNAWQRAVPHRLVPGAQVLVDCASGGYDPTRGWDGKTKSAVPEISPTETSDELRRWDAAAAVDDGDDLSMRPGFAEAAPLRAQCKTIATHTRETSEATLALANDLGLPVELNHVLEIAARWHDVGKAHPTFQAAIDQAWRTHSGLDRVDVAKAPEGAWRRPAYPERPGFRHELASALALFELLRRRDPWHAALLGPHREVLTALDQQADPVDTPADGTLADEIAALSAEDFDLLVFLVASHHGKVRCRLASSPRDDLGDLGAIRGVVDADALPEIPLHRASGELDALPPLALSLAPARLGLSARYGASWSERVEGLLERHGPFRLAFLEAVLRAADVRASRLDSEDALL